MQIANRKEGDRLIISPKGNIDCVTAPELDDAVSKVGDDVKMMELDIE